MERTPPVVNCGRNSLRAGPGADGLVLASRTGSIGSARAWQDTLRAYFMGHIGKYVPGKAMAVVLRIAGVRKWVTSIRIAIVTSLLETLTMMAVGAFLAAALSTLVLQLEPRLAAIGLVMAVAAGVPTLPPVARQLARLGLQRIKRDSALRIRGQIRST